MPGTLSVWDVIRSRTAREPLELRPSRAVDAGPPDPGPPIPRGEGSRRGVSVPSPLPCPQGCCQPRGRDLRVGSSLPLSGGCCRAAGVPLQCIPALGDSLLTGKAVQPSKPLAFPVVSNKL